MVWLGAGARTWDWKYIRRVEVVSFESFGGGAWGEH